MKSPISPLQYHRPDTKLNQVKAIAESAWAGPARKQPYMCTLALAAEPGLHEGAGAELRAASAACLASWVAWLQVSPVKALDLHYPCNRGCTMC